MYKMMTVGDTVQKASGEAQTNQDQCSVTAVSSLRTTMTKTTDNSCQTPPGSGDEGESKLRFLR